MKEYFLQSDFLFLLLGDQDYYLPNYERMNDSSEYGISHEDFVLQYNNEAMKDIEVCWADMTIEAKKRIISLAVSRINSERNNLTNIENGAIELGIEITNNEERKIKI